jgi:hypothetical protein
MRFKVYRLGGGEKSKGRTLIAAAADSDTAAAIAAFVMRSAAQSHIAVTDNGKVVLNTRVTPAIRGAEYFTVAESFALYGKVYREDANRMISAVRTLTEAAR